MGLLAASIVGSLGAAKVYLTPQVGAPVAASVAPQAALDPAATAPLPYDDGGNPLKNAEAQRLYEEALATFHGGTGQTRSLLLRAIELDPGFGAAQLRLTILFELDWTVRLRATVESEPSLSARDRALLSAIEPGFCPPAAHVTEAEKQADDLVAAHPRDEFVAWSRALFAQNDGEDGMCAYVRRIVTERPSFVTALAYLARACLPPSSGRSKQAIDLMDQCLRASPGATDCLASRVDLVGRVLAVLPAGHLPPRGEDAPCELVLPERERLPRRPQELAESRRSPSRRSHGERARSYHEEMMPGDEFVLSARDARLIGRERLVLGRLLRTVAR